MVIRVSRLSLFGLLALTLVNFIAFYYRESLPDHFFSISSSTQTYSSLSFYLTSVVTTLSFFLGPFLIFSLLGYLICYPFFFKKSERISDLVVVFSLVVITSTLSYFVEPSLLGEGLRGFYEQQLGPLRIFFISCVFSVLFVVGLANWSIKNTLTFFQSSWLFIRKKAVSFLVFLSRVFGKTTSFFKSPTKEIINKVSENLKGNDESRYEDLVSIDNEEEELSNFLGEGREYEEYDEGEEEEVFNDNDETVVVKPRKKLKKGGYLSQEKLIDSIDKKNRKVSFGPDQNYFEDIIDRLEEKLGEFKIDANVINVLKGPVVDTFEVELGPGIKVSKVTGITEDLSLALAGAPIRMIFPLKGKTTMGIEVPRNPREIIYLSDVLKSKVFRKSDLRLPIAMGEDAFGETKAVDLASMPHMLVAGATGAGKSVFVNTLLVSLLVKLDPSKLKLILIDPKQLELALYARLPHLILPVMTEPKTSSIALLWASQEMERRYSILKEMGVRNIEGFNAKLKRASREEIARISHFYEDTSEGYELPYIVVIVDEFADLILSKVGKDIEMNICRLAAKARASGIHLVLATQRPSVDVITGLIKSNFPTRVSFRVTSPVDSRTILNSMGAEKLLGKGDMLFKQGIEMQRLHSAYVDEDEIENLVNKMCKEEPSFDQSALDFIDHVELGEFSPDELTSGGISIQQTLPNLEGKDELYEDAVKVIRETKSASASMLQRRLKIGYNRAANLIEQLEQDNIVGPQQGSKPRKVLI